MTDQPSFGPWISHIDTAGQLATMTRSDASDGRALELGMDRLVLSLPDGDRASGVVVFSGSVGATVPEGLDLAGFLLSVKGQISRTAGTQAQLTAAIGNGTRSLEWPLVSIAGTPAARDDRTGEAIVETTDVAVTCLALDFNPAQLGVPPFLPLTPLPITVSMQARCRLPDEAVTMGVTSLTVTVVTF